MMMMKPSTLFVATGALLRPTVVVAGIGCAALFGGSTGAGEAANVESATAEEALGVGVGLFTGEAVGMDAEGVGDGILAVRVGA